MACSGFAKSASTCEACCETGVSARRLTGRDEMREVEVATASGAGEGMFLFGRSGVEGSGLLCAGRKLFLLWN